MMAALVAARNAMATIAGVSSCKVGIEANIGPADYPMIRIVPRRIEPGRPYHQRTCECLIYFGMPTANSEGLEKVYEDLFALEAQIIAKIKTLQGRYIETITDQDQIDTYKVMTVRAELEG